MQIIIYRALLFCVLVGVAFAFPSNRKDKLEQLRSLLKSGFELEHPKNTIQKRGWCSYAQGYNNKCLSDKPWCFTGLNSDGSMEITCSPKDDPCAGVPCQEGETCIKTSTGGPAMGFECIKNLNELVIETNEDEQLYNLICSYCETTGRVCEELPGKDFGCFFP